MELGLLTELPKPNLTHRGCYMPVGVKSVFIHSGYKKIADQLHGPVILEKLTVPQLVKNFPGIYGT